MQEVFSMIYADNAATTKMSPRALQVMLDVRIKDEEDLARICDAPVLGNIPDFNAQGKSSGYAYTSDAADRAGGK